ncbi:MAG: hypothetical protein GU359_01185 [Desulfurococcales archaeon]|nr:hypothetical protein [Desulfurococcales archaeon]
MFLRGCFYVYTMIFFNVDFDSGGGGVCISRLYRLILFESGGEKAFKKKDIRVILSKGCDPVIM